MLPLTGLVLLALLGLAPRLIWRRLRLQAARTGRPPERLTGYLLSAGVALPALTLWLSWLLDTLAPLALLERWLVAFALAWIITPFAALAMNRVGEALARRGNGRRPGSWS